MSFSQFIKIKNIIENYRQTDEQKEDLSLHNNQESINSSMYRPKSTKVQKLFTNKLFRKNERFKNINKIGFDENLININNSNNYNELYENITLILKNIINNNKENENKLCKFLRSIYMYIYDLYINSKTKVNTHPSLMVDKSTQQKKRIKTTKSHNKLKMKNIDYKKNEYNYLMYINELHKKVFKLEHELNLKTASNKTKKNNIRLFFNMNSIKYHSDKGLTITKDFFSIIPSSNFHSKDSLNTISYQKQNKKNLKISLKDIFNDIEKKVNDNSNKIYNNKKYLLSHPKLNFSGYIHNNNGKLSSIVNEKINRVPKEAFGVRLHTKFQSNFKSHLQLSFNPIKFRIEKLRANKNIDPLKY